MKEQSLYWPALCKSMDGTYFMTQTFYRSEQEAKAELGTCFFKLLREYPAIKLEVPVPLTKPK